MDQFRTLSPDISELSESDARTIKSFYVRNQNPHLKLKLSSTFTTGDMDSEERSSNKKQSRILNNLLFNNKQIQKNYEHQIQKNYEHSSTKSEVNLTSNPLNTTLQRSRNLNGSYHVGQQPRQVLGPAIGDWTEDDWLELRIQLNTLVPIRIHRKKLEFASCGWLISEVIRKLLELKGISIDPTRICSLRTGNGNLLMDLHLAELDRCIPDIPSEQILVPVLFTTGVVSTHVCSDDFELVRKLGAGGFSVVFLVRRRCDGQYYAMKVIDKAMMSGRERVELLMNERNILAHVRHKRVVRLHWAFQSVPQQQQQYIQTRKLYFVLDFCVGGELYYHLRKAKRFTESQTRSCCIQILQALDYLHKQDIIYRDLKPENILIDAEGYIKIADFGLSKKSTIGSLNFSFCGSLEYMAPEMISISGHDFSLDFYSLGVLLFELIVGLPPFKATSRQELMKSIVLKEISFPAFIPPKLKDLIQRLCKKDRTQRLGAERGVPEIFEHPWLQELRVEPIVRVSNELLAFDNIFLNQENFDFESGARCLAEEVICRVSPLLFSSDESILENLPGFSYYGRDMQL